MSDGDSSHAGPATTAEPTPPKLVTLRKVAPKLVTLRKVVCPRCDHKLAVPTSAIGLLECYGCRNVFPIPALVPADVAVARASSTPTVKTATGAVATRPRHSSLKAAVNKVMTLSRAVDHVALANKIGKMPTGFDNDIALAFQKAMKRHPTGTQLEADASYKITVSGTKWAHAHAGEAYVSVIQPRLFSELRKSEANLPESAYVASLTSNTFVNSDLRLIGVADASGKSSAYFFLTTDQRYIIKSCTEIDVKTLVKILPKYAAHFAKHTESWLPKYFGLYKIKLPGQTTQTLLVMNNWFAGRHEIKEKFDLKGSTHGRKASKAELAKPGSILKDLDWHRTGYELEFPDKEKWMASLQADVDLLSELRLIDYSLLVGVHPKVKGVQYSTVERAFVIKHNNSDTLIYFGIVDILTPYSFKKFVEKSWFHRVLRVNASCTDPGAYADRFFKFVEEISVDAAPKLARMSTYGYVG